MDATPTFTTAFPAADLLPVQRQATVAYRIGRALVSPLVRTLFSVKVEGRQHLPKDGAYVLIANHLSWIDSLTILMACPAEPRVHFLGDPTDLLNRRFSWWFVRRMGGLLPVDRSQRSGRTLFDHVDNCLERGGVVALYPEGRCGTEEGSVLPFKKGFAHFAVRAGVPVIPVGLSGHSDLWVRRRLTVSIGSPLLATTIDGLIDEGPATVQALLRTPRQGKGPKLLRRRLTHLF